MRLLRRSESGHFRLVTHDVDKLPPYAILSHTWGSDEDEVTFQDIEAGNGRDKTGYAKIKFCGDTASRDDLKDFWVDTCCIDKRNFTELSEAILSMFRWYQRATKCYVYLDEVTKLKHDSNGNICDWKDAFRKSRWFTRGWTLQELLAPKQVEFWSRDGRLLGTKETLSDLIHGIVDIPQRALLGTPLSEFSTPERLRWAAKRNTKKEEDKAYCLFGIFDVSLPILYGEERRAFDRLLDEIKRLQEPTRPTVASLEYQDTSEIHNKARRENALASLGFEQIDAHRLTLKSAESKTCGWLLQHPDYAAWSNKDGRLRHDSILWIVGKPGAGKSTLVNFLLAHTRKIRIPGEIVLDFFFNARGDYFERTTLGMYRALLVQMFEQAPELQTVLDNIDDPSFRKSTAFTWTLNTLQTIFHEAIKKLGSRKLKIFIDALDECDEDQVREMVVVLGDLVDDDSSQENQLSICLASRHYPSIGVHHSRRLVLEEAAGHADDLRKYIHRRLQAGKGRKLEDIRAQVQEKANGVFMWVVLVVKILNEEFRHGSIFAVERRLREIPTKLSRLFKDMLRRDHRNMEGFLLCLQWVLFAKRPLSCEEFFFSMQTGRHLAPEDGSQWRPKPWDPQYDTVEEMNEFVLSSSKGLAELTKSKKAPTVQFIHESVRDFLIKDGGIQELWPELGEDLASLSHMKLQKCCSDYLTADISNHADIPQPLPKTSSEEAKFLRQRLARQFPLLEYAQHGVLHHANEVKSITGQDVLLQSFSLQKWVHVHNLLEYRENRRYSYEVSLLYILAEHNLPALVENLPHEHVWLRLPHERYKYPVLAAFASGNREVLKALLGAHVIPFLGKISNDPGFGKASQCDVDEDPVLWAASRGNWIFAKYLLVACVGKGISAVDDQHLLSLAVRQGPLTAIRLLMEFRSELHDQTQQLAGALEVALATGGGQFAQKVIDTGADIIAQRRFFGRVLHAASGLGHEKIVQMLIDAGVTVEVRGDQYGDALTAASSKGHEKVVQVLINAGANVNAVDEGGNSALWIASANGHGQIVQMLVKAGVNLNVHGDDARWEAQMRSHDEVVKILVEAGVPPRYSIQFGRLTQSPFT